MATVPLTLSTPEPGRRTREPVTVGLPWPRGAVTDDKHFRLLTPPGEPDTLQTRVLDRWPDGSVRWCLFDFFATTTDDMTSGYSVTVADTTRDDGALTLQKDHTNQLGVVTGAARFLFSAGPLRSVRTPDGEYFSRVSVTPSGGPLGVPSPGSSVATENGPVRARVTFAGGLPVGLLLSGHVDCFAGSAAVRVQLTVTNPQPADHPGGNWDLGNGGSVFLDGLTWDIFGVAEAATASAERGQPPQPAGLPLTLHQESSGGENWRSSAHVDLTGRVNLEYRGYKLTTPAGETAGLRATPVVTRGPVGVAVPELWQNFPMAVLADESWLRLDLLPHTPGRPHEFQGGEQKTWRFTVAFAPDAVSDPPLAWGRSPLVVTAPPEWYASTGVVPYLTPKQSDPNRDYVALAGQALHGPDTFERKREVIDEYGWRNFGDIYGDHEAAFHQSDTPLVSHYNNQYDCVLALLQQYLRDGDPRWLDQGLACATHTADIDIYHTTGDKPAYNGGLFWHTYHYADAGTGTHRSYPRALRTGGHFTAGQDLKSMGETGAKLAKVYAVGGGPAGSHNYNAGLALAYFLTGDPLYRSAAVGLADFVLTMDAPRGGAFRLLANSPSGLATESSAGYHGPGRASANSVLALLTGYQLTGERKYLEYAETLIRRVSHPEQNLDRLDLLNAELRWFYTMFLQALGVYLDVKSEHGELDAQYAYGRATLLHYARWMATHERPVLDTPGELQYPTETWAAQDLRKVEVFQFAAKHAADPAERERFVERARFFHGYCAAKLNEFPTKSLCRPVILAMRYGWSHTWWQRHPDATAPAPTHTPAVWPAWAPFVPQKARAVRRAKQLIALGGVAGVLLLAAGVVWLAGVFG